MICPRCAHDNQPGARFCANCGGPLERTCPNCGQPAAAAAKFCSNCGFNLGAAAAPQGPPAPRSAGEPGERKLVTALFADIVGSTEWAEAMDPEDWRVIVSGAHARVSDAVYRYEGTIAQLLGDGVLAFFGAPLAHEDDAERAVCAALDILTAIRQYAGQLPNGGRAGGLQMRVGLNTGLVVVGNIGTRTHMEYLAVGDTVNLAARMQSAAEPDTVLISENTMRHVPGLFDVADLGRISVKGRAEAVQVYRVLAKRQGAIRARGIPGLTSPMVGRQAEFAALMQIIRDLRQRGTSGALVSVIGEAGLGKSRLVAEWRKAVRMDEQPGQTPLGWFEGRCLAFGSAVAYHLVTDLLRALLGVPPGATSDEIAAALRRASADLAQTTPQVRDGQPFLAHLLGLPLDGEQAARVRYLNAAAIQAQYAAALRAYLRALTRRGPLVIVAEDIHWADASSVDLLRQLLDLTGEAPLVFVLVTRADPESAGWRLVMAGRDLRAPATELHLAPLAEGDSQQLVSYLLDVAALPEGVRQLILHRAEGNPFYVEEVIRMLIERGGLQRQDNAWVVMRDLQEIHIPDTLQGVIMARIDRLPEDVKRTLQVAAVIGRRFQVDVLARVLEAGA